MDGPAHESTYNAFTHFTAVGAVFQLLAIGLITYLGVQANGAVMDSPGLKR